MSILAKFRVHHVKKHPANEHYDGHEEVHLSPVYSDDPKSENYSFSKATPTGQISMSITNPEAFGAFQENKEYHVHFTPVEPASTADAPSSAAPTAEPPAAQDGQSNEQTAAPAPDSDPVSSSSDSAPAPAGEAAIGQPVDPAPDANAS